MEKHDAGWPFLHAVNVKKFPSYKKIIKTPMDLSAMKAKLRDNMCVDIFFLCSPHWKIISFICILSLDIKPKLGKK